MTTSSPSVLVIRLDAVGDALALVPLLAALGDAGATADVVLTASNLDAYSENAVRHRYEAPFALRDESRANVAAVQAFGAELRANGYSHVLVATEDPAGYRLARAVRAPWSIGFENGWGKPLKTLWIRSMLTETVVRTAGMDARAPHEVEVLWSLGRALLPPGTQPSRDPRLLRPLVVDREPAPDPNALFQVTDKWERLGIAFDEVVACARAIPGVRCVTSWRERAYAERFAGASGLRVEFFDRLAPWKEAIAAGRALVAPDSGALHVAGMTGTPTVALFAPQPDLALQIARWHPWAAPFRAIEAHDGWPERVAGALSELTAREQFDIAGAPHDA